MAPGGGDLDRPLGRLLALDVGHVGVSGGLVRKLGLRLGENLAALEVVDQGQQVWRRQHLDLAGPGRLRPLDAGADQAPGAGIGVNGRRQHPGDPGQAAVEAQFSERRIGADFVHRQHVHGRQQADGDRKVEVGAFLQHIGGRQIDGDALVGQRQAHGVKGAAHPLAAFADRLVGQADDGKRRQPGGRLHLDVHVERLDALKGDR